MPKRNNDRLEILSVVEPFLDFDLASSRQKLIDDMIVRRYREELASKLADLKNQEHVDYLIDFLSEIKAEMHYLKSAYVEKVRYCDPNFNVRIPEHPQKNRPNALDIDMRSDITGANWWHAEPSGRWAGPENQSSVQVPALGAGKYRLVISVVSEIDDGIVDEMRTSFNGSVLTLQRSAQNFPCELVADVVVPSTYKLPFWSIKFEFSKLKTPREKGLPDDRRLAIMLNHIRLIRLED